MEKISVHGIRNFKGEFTPPPDKSISHRAVMFSALARGTSAVKNLLRAQDVESTVNAFRALGIAIEEQGDTMLVSGKGLRGLSEASNVIDCGNSGTTIRLISGVLSGNPFFSVLTGDDSLRCRPMARVITPLKEMGARISARAGDKYPPLAIKGSALAPLDYVMPVASAQVKSSLLLAGLYADGETKITEPVKSRDHTERMLPAYGATLRQEGLSVFIQGGGELSPLDVEVPGDFSSAAFFLTAALLVGDSDIIARNVGLNPTRTGLLNVLGRMGAKIAIENPRTVSGEPVADLHCTGKTPLKGVTIGADEVPSLIDEFPVLCAAAAYAEGTTVIRGAEELRVKESDRIAAIASELRKLGAEVEEYPDGLAVTGKERLTGAEVESHDDHRIAMAMAVAGLAAEGTTTINRTSAVAISFPDFFRMLARFAQ